MLPEIPRFAGFLIAGGETPNEEDTGYITHHKTKVGFSLLERACSVFGFRSFEDDYDKDTEVLKSRAMKGDFGPDKDWCYSRESNLVTVS